MNVFKLMFVALVVISAGSVDADEESAAELIQAAHKHDNMYTLGPAASQQEALKHYQSALEADPDDNQRLHILYRMGQLYGSSYQLEKGEKPNFHRAIELNKLIVSKYQPQEPLVYKAMSSICSHYTTLRDFESGLKWSKKVLEYDTAEQLESGQIDSKIAERIRRYQRIAVDQVAYTADRIDHLRTLGELRHISNKYYGTFIAERADELLIENMEKMPSLWAPTNDEPLPSSGPALQTPSPTATSHSERQKDIQIQSNVAAGVTERNNLFEPNIIEIPQEDKHVAKEPRAPPGNYFKKYLVIGAGLIVFILAAIMIRKK